MYISASPPEAPPLSDTTIGCFIRLFFWIAACLMRAIWSEAPPAPAATPISTGLLGSQAANDDVAANARTANAAAKTPDFLPMSRLLMWYFDLPRLPVVQALWRTPKDIPWRPARLPTLRARLRA